MSVCVAFNLSDGVVIAVDSATTMIDAEGSISKVFLDADKLFQLRDLRVGIATYGLAELHGRTIGSFIRQFVVETSNTDIANLPMRELIERLRAFFSEHYKSYLESLHALPFEQIPDTAKGSLGLVVGGFSPGSFQSEVWNIVIPEHSVEYSAKQTYGVGDIGFSWFASAIPITRYIKGIDWNTYFALLTAFQGVLGRDLSQEEIDQMGSIVATNEYRVKTNGMPIQSGIACAKFLVELVLGHYRFTEPHPIVGGQAKVGVVRYDHAAFQILE